MPIECSLLDGREVPLDKCPKCGAEPFEPFMRGMVQRGVVFGGLLNLSWWKAKLCGTRWAYCAVICWKCKKIVGYE